MKHAPAQLAKNYLFIVLGSIVYAVAFDWAFVPNEIAFGGITGLGQIINHFVPAIPIGVGVMLLNVPLFIAGWHFLGGHLLISSLVAMFLSNAAVDGLALLYDFKPMDPLLACIFGGLLLGISLGMIFLQGATTGGTDIVARLLKLKLTWLPMGKLLMAADLVVILSVALVFGSLETALYGLVALYISTLVMDGVLYGMDSAKVAYIISDKPEEIAKVIIHDIDRSVTYLEGEGGYSGSSKKVILCAFKQKEIVPIKEAIKELDPNAFMIVTAAHEVLGEGFRSYHQSL